MDNNIQDQGDYFTPTTITVRATASLNCNIFNEEEMKRELLDGIKGYVVNHVTGVAHPIENKYMQDQILMCVINKRDAKRYLHHPKPFPEAVYDFPEADPDGAK